MCEHVSPTLVIKVTVHLAASNCTCMHKGTTYKVFIEMLA